MNHFHLLEQCIQLDCAHLAEHRHRLQGQRRDRRRRQLPVPRQPEHAQEQRVQGHGQQGLQHDGPRQVKELPREAVVVDILITQKDLYFFIVLDFLKMLIKLV